MRALVSILSLYVSMGVSAVALAGPSIVGNGGDAVRCTDANGSPFKGLYSLDYLLTYQTRDANADVIQEFTWEASYARISALLARNNPDLAYSFQRFASGLDNFSDWTQPKIWREAGFGLVAINDQNV